MERNDLTATSWFTTRLAAVVLAAVGVLFLVRASWLGWDGLSRLVGGDDRLLGAGVGVAFLLIASLSWEKNQLRVRVAELMEALNQLLYGKDFRSQREAIDILLTALESKDPVARRTAHEHLMRLTGQSFAEDPSVWRAWWSANQATWASRK